DAISACRPRVGTSGRTVACRRSGLVCILIPSARLHGELSHALPPACEAGEQQSSAHTAPRCPWFGCVTAARARRSQDRLNVPVALVVGAFDLQRPAVYALCRRRQRITEPNHRRNIA